MIRYVPILRWKRGERVALQRLTAQARARTMPLVLLGSEQFKVKAATKAHAAVPAPQVFVRDVLSDWGKGTFFLDASSLPTQGTQAHPVATIAAVARAANASMIPVVHLGASHAYVSAVTAIKNIDGRGVCLRIDMQELFSVAHWLPKWPFPIGETDLIVDFGENVASAAALGTALDAAFKGLNAHSKWRSITVAGTSMPANFTGYTAGQHHITRIEAQLWSRLSALPLPYQLDYGDFASITTGVTPTNIAWGYPINVKYTLPTHFLIFRGVRTTGPSGVDMDVQLRGHANGIAGYSPRYPVASSWGDQTIDQIAVGKADPKGLEHWVQLSVNRHIELMHAILP
ncbi:hypothetical protein [Ensifer aridi]|uniref:beta family protein n=1 Tax=Ensifer aridi TaxID=1708715 RepID=UPI00358EB69B